MNRRELFKGLLGVVALTGTSTFVLGNGLWTPELWDGCYHLRPPLLEEYWRIKGEKEFRLWSDMVAMWDQLLWEPV